MFHQSYADSRVLDGLQIGQVSLQHLHCPSSPQETEIDEGHIQHCKAEMIRCQGEVPVSPLDKTVNGPLNGNPMKSGIS